MMAAVMASNVSERDRAIERVVRQHLHRPIKQEQKEAIIRLIQNEIVFCLLPTGYGKSAIYSLFPIVKDELYPQKEKHIALVISPLKSLMHDQVNTWTAAGISAAAIQKINDMNPAEVQGILNGQHSLLFSSPEAILLNPWWGMVKQLRNRICLLALDEAHCLTKWGESFRPGYKEVSKVRALLTRTPVLALTATATETMVPEILDSLHLQRIDTHLIGILPDRPNIYLSIKQANGAFLSELEWYVDILKRDGPKAQRAIIYTRTIDKVTQIYGLLMTALGDRAWDRGEKSADSRIVEMYHAQTDADSKERILRLFPQPESALRCVVATIAFGMGVQVPDIRFVFHWGPSKDVLSYWQEVGRCARDGQAGKALMYIYPRSVDKRFITQDMRTLVDESLKEEKCIRVSVLDSLRVTGMKEILKDRGACCCTCMNKQAL